MPRRLGSVVTGCLLVGAVAAGCGIPTQTRPNTISPGHVPFHLLQHQSPTTTSTQPPFSSLVSVRIYLLAADQQLKSVQRLVVSPAPLASVIAALIVGPTSSEAAGGTTTAIPNTVRVLSVTTLGNVVTVNFNDAFAQIAGNSTELAVSQVVFTVATQNGGGTGVVFEINGQRTSVPVASGAEVSGPVNFFQFLTPPTTTTAAPATAPA